MERFDLEKAVKIVGLATYAERADEGRDFDVACRMILQAVEKQIKSTEADTCLIETEQKRIVNELNGLPEYVVSERNGFKRTYIEKERAIHIVENMPFL